MSGWGALISYRATRPSACLTMMPSIFGVSRTASTGAPVAGNETTDRSEVMWRSTSEPSSPAVTKLLSRVEAPMAAMATPCPG